MAVSVFYNNFQASNEQDLMESLITEYIKIYGQDMWYIPRNLVNRDPIFNTDDVSTFTNAYLVEFYIKNVEGFDSTSNIMTKFGPEFRDTVTLTIAQRTFENEIGSQTELTRPREADLIFFPLNKKCFEIKFVDNKPFFYQRGKLMIYDLSCEVFEYSEETFATGIPDIDAIQKRLSIDLLNYILVDDMGNPILDANGHTQTSPEYDLKVIDPLQNNKDIQDASDVILRFDEHNPLAEGDY